MKKKIKKIGKIFSKIILSGFIIFEFYYYGVIDFRESRGLTLGEIKFLLEVYTSDDIDCSKIKIYSGKFFPSPIQNDNVAMSPNGNIYFSKKYFKDDFSKSSVWDKAWLVHEIMHVKQYKEQGQIFAWKAMPLQLNYIVFGDDPYNYNIEYVKKLADYNLEQQGDIAQDYFLYLSGYKKFSQKEINWYKNILNK